MKKKLSVAAMSIAVCTVMVGAAFAVPVTQPVSKTPAKKVMAVVSAPVKKVASSTAKAEKAVTKHWEKKN